FWLSAALCDEAADVLRHGIVADVFGERSGPQLKQQRQLVALGEREGGAGEGADLAAFEARRQGTGVRVRRSARRFHAQSLLGPGQVGPASRAGLESLEAYHGPGDSSAASRAAPTAAAGAVSTRRPCRSARDGTAPR